MPRHKETRQENYARNVCSRKRDSWKYVNNGNEGSDLMITGKNDTAVRE